MAKKDNSPLYISDELLAAVLDGNASAAETMRVMDASRHNPQLKELLSISAKMELEEEMEGEGHQTLTLNPQRDVALYPVMALAARSESNLCDIDCERYILRRMGLAASTTAMAKESKRNYWLRDKGTPVFNIGRLLELQGISVVRQFDATLEDLRSALINNGSVIVVVNGGLLLSGKRDEECPVSPDHAVVVTDYDPEMEFVVVHDPQSKQMMDCIPAERFLMSWQDSKCYMASAYRDGRAAYDPHPIDVSDIELDNELLDLRELLAENTHEIWARHRIKEGWTYGSQRDDALKQTPNLVPYSQLPDNEKLYDRETAMQTLKLVLKFGYEIKKKRPSK